jgi:titin
MNVISSCVVSDIPSAPRGPLIISDVMRNSMTVAWQPPITDGGSPVVAYIIERQDVTAGTATQSGWTRVDKVRGHVSTYTVAHLVEGHRYVFRVIAENDFGRGPALETRHAVEARSPFGKIWSMW